VAYDVDQAANLRHEAAQRVRTPTGRSGTRSRRPPRRYAFARRSASGTSSS
jgi:hypothetical protein